MYDIQKLKKLTEFELFNEGVDIVREDLLKDHLMKGGNLEKSAILQLIWKDVKVLKCEENILSIKLPVIICGDIQGRLDNCFNILELGGSFIETNQQYLFLRNYTNTQKFSIETLIYLWALKINHGSSETKYSPAVYKAWMNAFDSLPLVAIVNRQFFVCTEVCRGRHFYYETSKIYIVFVNHCMIFPTLFPTIYGRIQEKTLVTKVLNADILFTKKDFAFSFSYTACCNFLWHNNLIGVINGDQPLGEGFKLYRLTEKRFPSLISGLFSAPNKSGIVNKAAILRYERLEKFLVKQFLNNF